MSREYWYGQLEAQGEQAIVVRLRACMPSAEHAVIDELIRKFSIEYQHLGLKSMQQYRFSRPEYARMNHHGRVLEVLRGLRGEFV